MAVFTDLSDAEIASLLADYDLPPLRAARGIAEGVENTNFLLETAERRFVLTVFEKRVAAADLPFFMQVMERLARSGFPAPEPMATRRGALLSSARGKPAAIVTHLPGVWPRHPSDAQCAEVGAALARLHLTLADFPLSRANALSVAAWGPMVRPRLAEAERLRHGLAARLAEDLDVLEASWPRRLPTGVVHADLFPDNALFEGERLTGVIDFYFACTDALAYDLAVSLNAWCFDAGGAYDRAKGAAMIEAYRAVRDLSVAEREALPILGRGAAIRFLATRLADWSATPPGALVTAKDPLEYADKLEFHRRARAEDYFR